MGQVDGTEQAGCEWAARVFYVALRDGKEMRWCSRNSRDEVPCLWLPPPHPGASPLLWSTGGDCGLEFVSSLVPVQVFFDSCLDTASKSMERVLLHQPYEGQLLKLGVGGHKSIYAWCFLSHLSHSFSSWLFLHSFLLQ